MTAAAPAPEAIHDDAPYTLRAAADRLLHGAVKAATLRAAIERGDLACERLGRVHVVTPRALREWRERCRVLPKARVSTPIAPADNGSSAMAPPSVEQAALSTIAAALTKRSPPTSAKSSPCPSASIVPLPSRSARS